MSATHNGIAEALRGLAHPIVTLDLMAPHEDLRPLDEVVGRARIVVLGESVHAVPAFLQFRHRVFRYLATELGFTALVLEAGYPDLLDAHDWVSGKGDLADRPAAMSDQLDLYDWMRAHNETATRPLRLYGMDLPGCSGSWRWPALNRALAFLEAVEPDVASRHREAIELLLDNVGDGLFETSSRAGASSAERHELTARIAEIASVLRGQQLVFAERSSSEGARRALQCAVTAERADAQLNASLAGGVAHAFVRDAAMAETVRWILEREERVLVYAHNLHIQRWPTTAGPMVPVATTSFGQHLAAALPRDEVVTIATTFGSGRMQTMADIAANMPKLMTGEHSLEEAAAMVPLAEAGPPPPGTADAVLASANLGDFLVDLRRAPIAGPVADALRAVRTIRANDFATEAPLLNAFDAVVHFDRIEQLLPTPDEVMAVAATYSRPRTR